MCGITGLFYNNISNGLEIFESLLSIQHRGQDGAGIYYMDGNEDKIIKGKGLICNLFSYEELCNMSSKIFIGHTRYKTNEIKDSFQPIILKSNNLKICFSHNGNIINVKDIESILENIYDIKNSQIVSDSFLLFQLIFYFLENDIENSISNQNIVNLSNYLHKNVYGSFSIIMFIEDYGLVIMKDKFGIRPLIYGNNKNNDILVSSESCSLNNVLNYNIINDFLVKIQFQYIFLMYLNLHKYYYYM